MSTFLFYIAPAIGEIEQAFMGTLEQNQQAFFQFDLPEEGLTLKLDVETGSIVLYASTKVQNPNEALYDWRLETRRSTDVYISPDDLEDTSSISKRQDVQSANITLYVSIEGQDGMNTFILNTTYGDTSSQLITAGNSHNNHACTHQVLVILIDILWLLCL